jgi:pimeloyl-ACP methyl ester carboxylesterase
LTHWESAGITPGMQPTSHHFTSQRLQLHYTSWGTAGAPLLVLQHGGLDHGRSWDNIARALAPDWHVVCPDLRGHGDSAWAPSGDYVMTAFLADFAALVATVQARYGARTISLCAHSLGGNIASRYAGIFPENVGRLALIEGLGVAPALAHQRARLPMAQRMRHWLAERETAAARQPRRYASLEAAFARLSQANPRLSPQLARHLTQHAARPNADGTYSWKYDPLLKVWPVLDMAPDDVAALWAGITCPVQLFYGSESWATQQAKDGRLNHLANATVLEYEGAGHWLHHDQFDRFLADLTGFLRSS